jgi:hypothetical protein
MVLFFGTLLFVTWMAGPWWGIAAAIGVTAGWYLLLFGSALLRAAEAEDAMLRRTIANYQAEDEVPRRPLYESSEEES